MEECFFQACRWLDTHGRHGITLNPDKFHFAKEDVEFAGFEIGNNIVKPGKKYMKAISDFPTPKNLTDVCSWFSLINQVSFSFSMTDTMLPFRNLLKPSNTFSWDDNLQQAFIKSKTTIIAEIHNGVEIFYKSKFTCLATDWPKTALDTGSFRSNVDAQLTIHSAARRAGKIPWWEAASPMQQNHDTPQSRARH